jgi:hypothetical protein
MVANDALIDRGRLWSQGELPLRDNSVLGPEVEIGGTLTNLSTVIGPFFDRFAEVEPNEDARIRILGRRLREAGITSRSTNGLVESYVNG